MVLGDRREKGNKREGNEKQKGERRKGKRRGRDRPNKYENKSTIMQQQIDNYAASHAAAAIFQSLSWFNAEFDTIWII